MQVDIPKTKSTTHEKMTLKHDTEINIFLLDNYFKTN